MTRPWRIQYPGAAYHVMSRGVAKGDIFVDDQDRGRFVECLERTQAKFGLDIFAFVLMRNHYHLFLQTREANLSRAIQWLQTAYVVYYNRRHGRSGHLLQGRYKCIIVGEESYWHGLSQYIHLNPIRARAAKSLSEYKWSSYHDYVRSDKPHKWVKSERILASGGRDLDRQRRKYRLSLEAMSGRERGILDEVRHGLILGSERFIKGLQRRFGGPEANWRDSEQPQRKSVEGPALIERVVGAVMKSCGASRSGVLARRGRRRSKERDLALWILARETGMKHKEIGKAFGIGSGAATKAAARTDERLREDRKLRTAANAALRVVFKV